MVLTRGNVIFDILEPPAFQKYTICWVSQAFFISTFFYMYFATQPSPSLKGSVILQIICSDLTCPFPHFPTRSLNSKLIQNCLFKKSCCLFVRYRKTWHCVLLMYNLYRSCSSNFTLWWFFIWRLRRNFLQAKKS